MADLMNQLVTGVIENVLKEILKKAGVSTTTKRKKRQARTATGRFKHVAKPRVAKAPKRQISRRKTTAGRSKARTRS